MRRLPASLVASLTLCAFSASAETVVGRASVIDGDTIEIQGERIRLHGIDAPESSQLCRNSHGGSYRCGQQAAFALSDRIGSSTVSCERWDTDRYGRIVGVCQAGGEDLNAWMAARGWAVAYREYSSLYADQEQAARLAGLGIWSGTFTPPSEFRRARREAVRAPADQPTAATRRTASASGCRIKGNISSKGERIYHLPGSRDYARTRIDEKSGERWFCSAADAQAAGWRIAR